MSTDKLRDVSEMKLDLPVAEILRIAHEHGATSVRVFGSRARGDFRPNSDLDLLVRLEPKRSLFDLIAIQQDLEDLLGCKVDVVTENGLSPYIRERVLAEALPLTG
jgi:predicted nucleotidyltransferase